ncbi:interferon-inducible double-stranded RNA-dependent protein kinase activator A homolog isoform X2 [Anopheles arabiensis]|uniref:interferon-inducible double-stranded RNA-dependent protein kinase activator A homolog isoform X2 n=1 Tax=Anopheles arabiensis TaxID=7173 RepID=UPI00002447D3|nr:interferon-inducible double-stranded RNA-dependent protein kinase activator A homolog isoform X2 [Anopheles arabiensis]XP_040237381.1 interferon-inducible double-stranded RNA-dependent protein kinase activator A homolog isoform X2 [Anopheles coluzzii]XP_041779022.1 interferon-inducible double-stranded RNA-dependent protein kinase activator A homolog isoform X2 [Anopheles merus]
MEEHNMHLGQPMPMAMSDDPPTGNPNPHQGKKASRGKKAPKVVESSQPIEEALKSELTTNNMKTPISVLQELLSRRGITPQYDLIQVEGAVHEPTFRYRVSYQDKDAMGTGKSKKEAKHAAAKALIDKLTGSIFLDHPAVYMNVHKPEVVNVHTNNNVNGEEEPTGNPIGWLQEMCMARRLPPPTYETETEEGLPHERQFTIACVVLNYREVGEGKSKKIAKRQAAQRMWQRLQDQPLEPSQIMQLLDEEGNEENLSLCDRSIDFIRLLADIAKEQRFEVTYVDIEEKAGNGKFQCLVQLSTMPVAVCHGSGNSIQEAQSYAARNSLEYLKIMTKP